MEQAWPQMVSSINTFKTARIVLNAAKSRIREIQHHGGLADTESERLMVAVKQLINNIDVASPHTALDTKVGADKLRDTKSDVSKESGSGMFTPASGFGSLRGKGRGSEGPTEAQAVVNWQSLTTRKPSQKFTLEATDDEVDKLSKKAVNVGMKCWRGRASISSRSSESSVVGGDEGSPFDAELARNTALNRRPAAPTSELVTPLATAEDGTTLEDADVAGALESLPAAAKRPVKQKSSIESRLAAQAASTVPNKRIRSTEFEDPT